MDGEINIAALERLHDLCDEQALHACRGSARARPAVSSGGHRDELGLHADGSQPPGDLASLDKGEAAPASPDPEVQAPGRNGMSNSSASARARASPPPAPVDSFNRTIGR